MYEKMNLINGSDFNAGHVEHLEAGIYLNSEEIQQLKEHGATDEQIEAGIRAYLEAHPIDLREVQNYLDSHGYADQESTLEEAAAQTATYLSEHGYQPNAPVIKRGSASIAYTTGSGNTYTDVVFDEPFDGVPGIILSQPFQDKNILAVNVTEAGFRASLSNGFSSSGTRAFTWIACG